METIKLPDREELLEVFNYDKKTGKLFYKETKSGRSSKEAVSKDVEGYLRVCLNYKTYRLHRIIYKMVHGDFDESLQIDHVDGNVSNNRIKNLKAKTTSGNAKNQKTPKDNKTGQIGVCYRKSTKRYRVSISVDKKQKELGTFKTLEEAIKVRKESEKQYGYHENHGR